MESVGLKPRSSTRGPKNSRSTETHDSYLMAAPPAWPTTFLQAPANYLRNFVGWHTPS